METSEALNKEQGTGKGVGVSYPVQSIDEILDEAKKIVGEVGTSRPISKEEISRILGKKVNSLVLVYSTLVQYGIFTLVHGKGYLPTDLYRRYTQPKTDHDEERAKLEMFNSPPLYSKIIQNLNNHQLPSDEKRFANTLKDEPYNVNPNSADRAAKIFFENARNLKLLDVHNTLKFSLSSNIEKADFHKPPPAAKDEKPLEESLFELPIPLPNKRKAFLKYPLDNLTRKDITVITKALEFIASSLDDDEIKKE